MCLRDHLCLCLCPGVTLSTLAAWLAGLPRVCANVWQVHPVACDTEGRSAFVPLGVSAGVGVGVGGGGVQCAVSKARQDTLLSTGDPRSSRPGPASPPALRRERPLPALRGRVRRA